MAKSKSTKPAARKPKSDAVPLTKPEAKKALDREGGIIKRLRKDRDRNAWQIGRRLMQIASLELHKAAAFDTIEAYAEKAFAFSRTATFQYMRIAQAFSQEVSATFGIEKLDRALMYIAKTPEEETAKDIPSLRIRVPDGKGGVHEKPFAEVNVPELRAAARHEAEANGQSKKKAPPSEAAKEHAARLALANRALDKAVGASNADRAEVVLHATDGLVLVDVRGIPVGDVTKALAAVAQAFAGRAAPSSASRTRTRSAKKRPNKSSGRATA